MKVGGPDRHWPSRHAPPAGLRGAVTLVAAQRPATSGPRQVVTAGLEPGIARKSHDADWVGLDSTAAYRRRLGHRP